MDREKSKNEKSDGSCNSVGRFFFFFCIRLSIQVGTRKWFVLEGSDWLLAKITEGHVPHTQQLFFPSCGSSRPD